MKDTILRIFKLGSVYSIGTLLEQLLSFIFLPLYTFYLTPADYGIVGIMTITIVFIAPFFSAPVYSGFFRNYFLFRDKKRKVVFFNTMLFIILQGLIIAILFLFFSKFLARMLLSSEDLYKIINIYSFILFGTFVRLPLLNLLKFKKKAKQFVIMNISRLVLSVILLLYLLIIQNAGVYALVYTNLFRVYFDIIFTFPLFLKNITFKFRPKLLVPLMKYGCPLILQTVSFNLMDIGDRYIIKHFSTLSEVGLYSFGYQIAGLIVVFVIAPMKKVVNPFILELEKTPDKLKQLLSKITTYFVIVSTFCVVCLSLLSREVIILLSSNSEFWASWIIVPFVAFSYIFYGLRELFGKGLSISRKTGLFGLIYFFSAILNIVLNVIFVPIYGMIAAAMTTLITYFLSTLVVLYCSNHYYTVKYDFFKMFKVLALGICLVAFGLIFVKSESLFLAIAYKSLLVCIFVLSLFMLKIFSKEEIVQMNYYFTKIVNLLSKRDANKPSDICVESENDEN